MEKELLQQIANTLFINVQRVKQYGLLNGKLGVAIFFYHYARYTGDEKYSCFPDECLEYIHDRLGMDNPEKFADGLSGIAWGIDYLIREKFVEADEDILEEVDKTINKMDGTDFLKEIELPIPLFSKGLYCLQRKQTSMIQATIPQLTDLIGHNNLRQFPVLYISSILYFVLVSKKIGIESDCYPHILEKLFQITKQILTNKKAGEEELLLINKNISLMEDACKKNWEMLIQQESDYLTCLKETQDNSWIDFLFPEGVQMKQKSSNIQHVNQIDYNNLSIYQGLAGFGISLMKSACKIR